MPPTELSVLRLVRVPQGAPPYDCQVHGPGCPGAEDPGGRPAAAGPPAAGTAALVGSPAALRTVRQREPGEAARADGADGAAPPWQFAQVIVEILAGFRAPGQLVALTTDRARGQIKRVTPQLVTDRRPRIQRIVTSRPAAGAVEMTVIVSFGPRPRALALRFEHMAEQPAAPGRLARPARWVCTAVEAG
jgi:Family of unknown function (DUF6459)